MNNFKTALKELAIKHGYSIQKGIILDYKTADGTTYVTFHLEKSQTMGSKYSQTYNYKELLKQYKLDTVGLWTIYGEDSNAEMHGSHIEPELETVEGKLSDVIDYAVNLKGFWAWGAGGRIKKIEVKML